MSKSEHHQRPKVGVGVFIRHPFDPSKILLGDRLGSLGAGTWGLPGGHLEFGETFEACAIRETAEETLMDLQNVRFLTATNGMMPENDAHYVTIFMVGEINLKDMSAEQLAKGYWKPFVAEPEKCAGWMWTEWDYMVSQAVEQGRYRRESKKSRKDTATDIASTIKYTALFSPLIDLIEQRPGISLNFAMWGNSPAGTTSIYGVPVPPIL